MASLALQLVMLRQAANRHARHVLALAVKNQRVVDLILHGVEGRTRQSRRQVGCADRGRIEQRHTDRITESRAKRSLGNRQPLRGRRIGRVKVDPVLHEHLDRVDIHAGEVRDRLGEPANIAGEWSNKVRIERRIATERQAKRFRSIHRRIKSILDRIGHLPRQEHRREQGQGVRSRSVANRDGRSLHQGAVRHRHLRQRDVAREQLSRIRVNRRPAWGVGIDQRRFRSGFSGVGEKLDSLLQGRQVGNCDRKSGERHLGDSLCLNLVVVGERGAAERVQTRL